MLLLPYAGWVTYAGNTIPISGTCRKYSYIQYRVVDARPISFRCSNENHSNSIYTSIIMFNGEFPLPQENCLNSQRCNKEQINLPDIWVPCVNLSSRQIASPSIPIDIAPLHSYYSSEENGIMRIDLQVINIHLPLGLLDYGLNYQKT